MDAIMPEINPKWQVDSRGRRLAVVIDFKSYQKLIAYVEALEETAAIHDIEVNGEEYTSYEDFRKELKKAGKL